MKIEVWTATTRGYRQRVFGNVDAALSAARISLEEDSTLQIRLVPERAPVPLGYDDAP